MLRILIVLLIFTLVGCKSTKPTSRLEQLVEAHRNYAEELEKEDPTPQVHTTNSSLFCLSQEEYDLASNSTSGNVLDITDEELEVKPRLLRSVPPKDPEIALENNIEGYVKASTVIDERGCYIDIQIVESSPEGVFDDSMFEALRKWRYSPGYSNGKPVKVSGYMQFDFQFGPKPQAEAAPEPILYNDLESLAADKLSESQN
ncbi:energy transducer TonB [Alteromonas sp. KUL49]|uniref:energy transducer TonB n=1 Tax=Alteromonas sp. KUL49 TaxID=2480798 RepID=UPI00102F1F4E|nr:energy transducer TonB [Alteromonas sp. KUL49]TAP40934.1 energy transducer TonB [Alteromonas sp. KUL49]GEA11116.1 hypothetical protein KUL49_14910 [Alteromonas sp. KUL49]